MAHGQINRYVNHDRVSPDDVVERALSELRPRLRRAFPIFTDDALETGILERASRQIRQRRQQDDVIANLQAYAWVTLRHVALSWLRSGVGKMAQRTVSASQELTMPALMAVDGTADQIETHVLANELLARLTPRERHLCQWRAAGFTSREIAAMRDTSAGAIDTSLSRIRRRLRRELADLPSASVTSCPGAPPNRRLPLRTNLSPRSSLKPRTGSQGRSSVNAHSATSLMRPSVGPRQ
jgi:RNA polymerase sigma factor (sigma-70 family)